MSKTRVKIEFTASFIYALVLCCIIGLLIWAILEHFAEGAILLGVCAVGTIAGIIKCANYQIEFDEDGFSYRNFFRKTQYFKWSELDSFRFSALAYKIYYAGKNRIRLDKNAIYIIAFERQLEKSQALQGLPKLKKRDTTMLGGKYLLFYRYIYRAHKFLTSITIITLIAVIGYLLFSLISLLYKPLDETQLESLTLTYHHTEIQDGYTNLYFKDQEKAFCIDDIYDHARVMDWTSFRRYAYRGMKLTLLVEKSGEKTWVHAICDAYRNYLTLEGSNSAYKKKLVSEMIWFLSILFIIIYLVYNCKKAPNGDDMVRLSKIELCVGSAAFCLTAVMIIVSLIQHNFMLDLDTLTKVLIALPFGLLSIVEILNYARWSIRLTDRGFVYTSWLGHSKVYSLEDIVRFEFILGKTTILLQDGKCISLVLSPSKAYIELAYWVQEHKDEIKKRGRHAVEKLALRINTIIGVISMLFWLPFFLPSDVPFALLIVPVALEIQGAFMIVISHVAIRSPKKHIKLYRNWICRDYTINDFDE